MSGIQEYNQKYIRKINKVLEGQPDHIKGFANYMNETALSTRYAYLHDVINFVNKVNKPLEDLRFDDFSGYISSLEYKENGEPVTSSYRIAIYSAIKKYCKYLYVTNRIPENFMKDVERPRSIESQKTIQKRENGFLTKKEIAKYIHSVENNQSNRYRQPSEKWNKRDKAIIMVFLATGIRCSALMKLDIANVDFRNKNLIVTDKGGKVRIIDIPNDVLGAIKDWLEIRSDIIDDDYPALFISNRRKRMEPLSIYNVVHKYSNNIARKNITPHKLRATYGTQLYKETGDIYFVQDCMGHSNPKTTELYVRGENHTSKRASDIMGRMLV